MISVYGYKFNKKPYLTLSESKIFARMMNDGTATIFNIRECKADGCKKFVPKGVKLYCSQTCFIKEEGYNEEDQ